MSARVSSEDGFTLVELLVALALLSLMMIYALNAYSSMHDMGRVTERFDAQMEVEAVVRHFRESISDARPLFVMGENNSPHFLFNGAHDSLEFVADSNGDRETGGLYLVRYAMDETGALISERRVLRDNSSVGVTTVTLLRGIKGISYRFWKPGETKTGYLVEDSWEKGDSLPAAVEVVVDFAETDARKWPLTVVRVWNMP